ncbi:MAG: cobalt-precorrin-5B (C(1))-methyltransferase CbiD [Cyanobacteria bacterium P01_D01_bin.123]
MAESGFTLPVFAVAAAKAALLHVQDCPVNATVALDLLPGEATIAIEQVAKLSDTSALGIAHSKPGDGLDVTRNTPIWARVELVPRKQELLVLEAGEGLGRTEVGEAAIYRYAKALFAANLLPLVPGDRTAIARVILPEGKVLAQRTSNAAFGIVDGLALLGTSGIAQPLTAPEKLEEFRQHLHQACDRSDLLTFCLGSNGLQVAARLGIPEQHVIMTANWIGAMLVEAGELGVRSVLLLGYHGKLLKLAGGIFHTSSHLADAKREILAAATLQTGGDAAEARHILATATAEEARLALVERDRAEAVFGWIAARVSANARNYVRKYVAANINVGTILFDRRSQLVSRDRVADDLLSEFHRMK